MPPFEHPPIKRHPSLQPFSRDHYQALVQARHLMKAADGNAQDRRKALAEFLDVWEHQIQPHFDDEERLLADLSHDALRLQLLQEHRRLRDMAAEAREHRRRVDPAAAWVRMLGETLNAHVRWEERELFATLESSAPAQLDRLQPQAARIEASRPRGRNSRSRSNDAGRPTSPRQGEDAP